MLVLSRKVGEAIVIGDGIVVTVTRMANNRVTLGIDAPGDVRVLRSELVAHEARPPFEREEVGSRRQALAAH
jgi:carbon storage regulator